MSMLDDQKKCEITNCVCAKKNFRTKKTLFLGLVEDKDRGTYKSFEEDKKLPAEYFRSPLKKLHLYQEKTDKANI